MGQIVSAAAKPKRCNLNKLSQLGTPAAGEYILVSSDNSMNAAGQGNFDAYIVGDGKTAATALPLHYLADIYPVEGGKNPASSGSVYDLQEGIIHPQYTLTTGAILPDGTTSSSANYSYSTPILLKKNQCIYVRSRGYGYAAISQYSNNTYTPLVSVSYQDGNPWILSQYLAPQDMYVAVCVRSVDTYDVYADALSKIAETSIMQRELNNFLLGQGKTYVYKRIYGLIPNRTYRVFLKNKNWDKTGITSTSDYIWLIRNDYNGSYTVLVGVLNDGTPVSDYYDITIPANSDYLTIGGRAATDVLIEFAIEDYTEFSEADDRVLNNYLVGKGATYVSKAFYGLAQGRTYRFIPQNYQWDTTGAPAQTYKLEIANYYGGFDRYLVQVALETAPKRYYDFTIPENSDYIKVGGRAANGTKLQFTIVDYTDILPPDQRLINNYLVGNGQTYVSKQLHGLIPNRTYRFILRDNNWDTTGITGSNNYKFLIRNDYNGAYTILVGKYLSDEVDKYYDITIPANSDYLTIGGRAAVGTEINFEIIDYTDILQSSSLNMQTIIFSINHRGYSLVAPENTLPAFILSRKMGFFYVETDVAFTSDNVAVLMHDSTINRTARNPDGTELSSTIYIYDITYAQALQYDYGIWKGAEWAGTPIPTFREFIQCCKEMSLHPFIELKNSVEWTQARCQAIADDIFAVGMEKNVSFISFDENALAYVSSIFPDAMIGLGYQGVYNTQNLTAFLQTAASLKTSTNKVLVSLRYSDMTSSLYDLVSAAGVNSIVWTVNSATDATNLNDNTIGVLSDSLNAGKLIIEKNYQTLPI